ncbi:MAG: hypothetical protein AB1403_21840, partial [Candidatus Riflebacteria bacterium]
NLSGFSSLFDSDKVQIGMDEKKHLLIKPENLTEFSFPGRSPKILIFLIRFVQKIKLPSHALCGIGQKPLAGFRLIVLNLYARGSRNGQIFKMSRLLRLFQSFQGFYDMMCRCQNLNEMRDALLRMLNAKVVYINGGSHG